MVFPPLCSTSIAGVGSARSCSWSAMWVAGVLPATAYAQMSWCSFVLTHAWAECIWCCMHCHSALRRRCHVHETCIRELGCPYCFPLAAVRKSSGQCSSEVLIITLALPSHAACFAALFSLLTIRQFSWLLTLRESVPHLPPIYKHLKGAYVLINFPCHGLITFRDSGICTISSVRYFGSTSGCIGKCS